jgi:Cu+-exporting ATPase
LNLNVDPDRLGVTSAPGNAAPAELLHDGKLARLRPGQHASHRSARPPHPRAPADACQESQPPGERQPFATVTDPVCGMVIEPGTAAIVTSEDHLVRYFCSRACRDLFEADPRAYADKNG